VLVQSDQRSGLGFRAVNVAVGWWSPVGRSCAAEGEERS